MRSEIAGRKPIKGSTHCKLFLNDCRVCRRSPCTEPAEWGRKREGNSWRQSERAVDVHQRHVVMRHHRHFSSTAEIHEEPDRDSGAEEGGSRRSTQGHRIEGNIHTLSQFTVLGGWLCSLCLEISSPLCLPLSARGKAEISWCLHKHNDPRSCVFLNQKRKTKLQRKQ